MKILGTITLILLGTTTFAQSLSSEIESIYTFKPSKLTDKEQETKLPALDKFWEEVKRDTTKYLPMLRLELRQTGHNPFFYYDGSALLLSLSESKSDKELAVNAITRCDLDDINRQIYVSTLNKLAREGINVTPAAVRILKDDKFSFFITQHAMSFDQSDCLAYMLIPENNDYFIDTLISLFPRTNNTAKISIMTTLWYAYSCKGDNFLKAVANDQKINKEIQEYANKIKELSVLSSEEQNYTKTITRDQLAELRKTSLQRFSDEAIDDLILSTKIMRREMNCQ